jgi:hypothetical protein
MQLTILPADNLVNIDGRSVRTDLQKYAELLKGIEAVKWDDVLGYGFIEYGQHELVPDRFRGTERITDLAPYQAIIDEHRSGAAKQDAELANATDNNSK